MCGVVCVTIFRLPRGMFCSVPPRRNSHSTRCEFRRLVGCVPCETSSPSKQSHCPQLRNHHHHFHEAAILLALRKPRSPRIPPRDSRHWVDAQEVIFHRATTPRRLPSRRSNPNKASSPQTPSSHLFPPPPLLLSPHRRKGVNTITIPPLPSCDTYRRPVW